jgi:hypothetical protein
MNLLFSLLIFILLLCIYANAVSAWGSR